MRRAIVLCVVVMASAGAAVADEVFLVGGGRVSGWVVEKTATTIVVDIGAGRVTLPLSRVERVVSSRSPVATFRERAQALAADDLAGWLALGYWAQERSLATPAREAFEKVVRLDPQNVAAHEALGHVQQDGRWMTPEQGYQARGLVEFEGAWVTPSERDAIRRERRQAEADQRSRAVDEARVREAQARAAAAEAEARRAEQEPAVEVAPGVETVTFVPIPVPVAGPGGCRPGHGHGCPTAAPTPAPHTDGHANTPASTSPAPHATAPLPTRTPARRDQGSSKQQPER